MKPNRLCILACFVLACATASAFAQTEWKGFYLGGNAGGVLGRSEARTLTVFSSTGYFANTSPPAINALSPQHPEPNGFAGGVQAGYNFQNGRVVFGVEAEMGALDGSSISSGTATYPCCAPTTFTVTQRIENHWLFTARPRFGVTAGRALLYVTGGVALTNLDYKAVFTDTFANALETAHINQTRVGWTAGAGMEYRMGKHWSVKAEYLYADFGSASATSTNLTAFTPPVAFPSNVFTHIASPQMHIVRAGFNYRF